MKKNAIGHMRAEKPSFAERIKNFDLIPFLLCILLAAILWLVLVNTQDVFSGSKDKTIVEIVESWKKTAAVESQNTDEASQTNP